MSFLSGVTVRGPFHRLFLYGDCMVIGIVTEAALPASVSRGRAVFDLVVVRGASSFSLFPLLSVIALPLGFSNARERLSFIFVSLFIFFLYYARILVRSLIHQLFFLSNFGLLLPFVFLSPLSLSLLCILVFAFLLAYCTTCLSSLLSSSHIGINTIL